MIPCSGAFIVVVGERKVDLLTDDSIQVFFVAIFFSLTLFKAKIFLSKIGMTTRSHIQAAKMGFIHRVDGLS